MQRPAVDGRAPELTGLREVIRRHTALQTETSGALHREEAAMAPDVSAVMGDVEGDVADHLHADAASMLKQLLPLHLQLPLEQGFPQQRLPVGLVEGLEGRAPPAGQGSRPRPPGLTTLVLFQDDKAAVVLEPMAFLPLPLLKGLPDTGIPARVTLQQRIRQSRRATLGQVEVQPRLLLGRGESAQVFSAEETSGQQRLRVQEPGIQRERTRGAVGGAQTVGGRQR